MSRPVSPDSWETEKAAERAEAHQAAARLGLPEDGVFRIGDTCPACSAREVRTVNWPWAVNPTDNEDGWRADYRCKRCGHRWFTGWMVRF